MFHQTLPGEEVQCAHSDNERHNGEANNSDQRANEWGRGIGLCISADTCKYEKDNSEVSNDKRCNQRMNSSGYKVANPQQA